MARGGGVPAALAALLLSCLLVTLDAQSASPTPSSSPAASRSAKPLCTLVLPSALPDSGDTSDEGAARAAADAKLAFTKARREALNSQLTCLMAYETDLTAAVDQLQGVIVPDKVTQLQQARTLRDTLVNNGADAATLRKAREAENKALSRRLDALLARAESVRKEQMSLIEAAATGGELARTEAARQERLVKEVRDLVPRIETLRNARDAEKVSAWGGPLHGCTSPSKRPPLRARARAAEDRRRRGEGGGQPLVARVRQHDSAAGGRPPRAAAAQGRRGGRLAQRGEGGDRRVDLRRPRRQRGARERRGGERAARPCGPEEGGH